MTPMAECAPVVRGLVNSPDEELETGGASLREVEETIVQVLYRLEAQMIEEVVEKRTSRLLAGDSVGEATYGGRGRRCLKENP